MSEFSVEALFERPPLTQPDLSVYGKPVETADTPHIVGD